MTQSCYFAEESRLALFKIYLAFLKFNSSEVHVGPTPLASWNLKSELQKTCNFRIPSPNKFKYFGKSATFILRYSTWQNKEMY
jgi:hypothetical protein